MKWLRGWEEIWVGWTGRFGGNDTVHTYRPTLLQRIRLALSRSAKEALLAPFAKNLRSEIEASFLKYGRKIPKDAIAYFQVQNYHSGMLRLVVTHGGRKSFGLSDCWHTYDAAIDVHRLPNGKWGLLQDVIEYRAEAGPPKPEAISDEEIIREAKTAGEDPEAEARKVRTVLSEAIREAPARSSYLIHTKHPNWAADIGD